ncbi:hypothetical protein EVAR_60354_1 [Eumeta japonica]|uniref:Uncharacterized protein n=1 Tax=Eumeta variegata TaxID=151549 RepID=A0A4C1ZQL9_EUMVA|nr:hypothetical protein EVAR_60354_1 [Eumeta japonica]
MAVVSLTDDGQGRSGPRPCQRRRLLMPNNGSETMIENSELSQHLYDEPHSIEIVFGRHHEKRSFTQIVSSIKTATFEHVKPVISNGKGWSFVMKSHSNSMALALRPFVSTECAFGAFDDLCQRWD